MPVITKPLLDGGGVLLPPPPEELLLLTTAGVMGRVFAVGVVAFLFFLRHAKYAIMEADAISITMRIVLA